MAPPKSYRATIFGTDTIWPRLIVRAGFDGRAFQPSLGVFRDACKNLSIPRQLAGTTASIKHTDGMRLRIADVVEKFRYLANNWENVVAAMQQLERREVNLASFVRSVFPAPDAQATARTTGAYERRISAIFSRIHRERMTTGRPELAPTAGGDFIVSAFEAYNAIQGYAQHDARRRGDASDNQFGRAIAAWGDESVGRALELALSV